MEGLLIIGFIFLLGFACGGILILVIVLLLWPRITKPLPKPETVPLGVEAANPSEFFQAGGSHG